MSLEDYHLLSRYYMREVPWNSPEKYSIAVKILEESVTKMTADEMESLRKTLESEIEASFSCLVSKNETKTIGGLRPQLGILDKAYDARQAWKTSPSKYMMISSLYFVLSLLIADEKGLRRNWNLYLSATLKTLEDSDYLIKTCGCLLTDQIVDKIGESPNYLTKLGMDIALKEAVKICLTYLPSLAKIQESVVILPAAFKTSLSLIDKCSKDNTDKENGLADFLIENVVARYANIRSMDQGSKLAILVIYLDVCNEVIKRLFSLSSFAPNLIVRKLLWGLILNVLADEFILVGATQEFTLKLLTLVQRLFSISDTRKYKYDILAATALFIQSYEIERPRKLNESLEIDAIDLLLHSIIENIVKCYDDEKQAQEELEKIFEVKPFMRGYYELDITN